MSNQSARRLLLTSSAILAISTLALAGPADAQTTAASSPDDRGDAKDSDIVVTGSRISRRDYVADSPIVSVSPKAIENSGDVTLERTLNNLPQLVPNGGSQVNSSSAVPANGQLNIAMRGLGATRTLVLVDGRRVTPSGASGVVDINTIPQALLENIEVITGGASATYGSDAVAGVVNFKLKHNFQGVVADAGYNISGHGDGREFSTSLTMGGNFADSRGNAVLSLSYDDRRPVLFGDRPGVTVFGFPTPGVNNQVLAVSGLSSFIPSGSFSTTATNLPTQAAINGVFAKYGVAAGTISANSNLGFNTDGTLFRNGVNYKGSTALDFSSIPTSTGAGPGNYNTGPLSYALLPQKRFSAFSTVDYELTPDLKIYGQFSYADIKTATRLAATPASTNPGTTLTAAAGSGGTGFLVPVTNPFIPADLRTILASRPNPTAPFVFSKRFNELGAREDDFENTTYQALVGAKGELPWQDIHFDVFGSYGKTRSLEIGTGGVSHQAMRQLLESPTGSSGDCVGYNPFGTNGISAACAAFISPTIKNLTTYTQKQLEIDLQGRIIELPAGEMRFALGGDYRQDHAAIVPDALVSSIDRAGTIGSTTNPYNNAPNFLAFGSAQPFSGGTNVYEAYGELLVPVLKELPFVKSLTLDLGIRQSNYNTIGGALTYKADATWQVDDRLTFRGGYSRAIRAPNIGDLYTPQRQSPQTIGSAGANVTTGDPCDVNSAFRKGNLSLNAAAIRGLCLSQGVPAQVIDSYTFSASQANGTTGGNPLLKEERADTFSMGMVVQPHFSSPLFSRLSLSVDYYNIAIDGLIAPLTLGTVLQSCYNANGLNPSYSATNFYCASLSRDPSTGAIAGAVTTNLNQAREKTGGIDFQMDWGFGLDTLGLADSAGSLNFNLVGTYLTDFRVQSLVGGPFLQYRGSIGTAAALPVWKGVLTATYTVGKVEFGVTEHYIGKAKDVSCVGLGSACTARGVAATSYVDLNARWHITPRLEVRAGITNVTDQEPRFFTSANTAAGYTDPSSYDLIGRRFFLAVKARY